MAEYLSSLAVTKSLLARASVIDVILNQLIVYEEKHGRKPTLGRLNINLRAALTKEQILLCGLAPDCAIAEICWLDTVPICFAALGDTFLELSDKARGIVETI